MINIVIGDLLRSKENLILHQVNCQAVMGSGVAKQIRDMWGFVYEEYNSYCKSHVNPKELLGKAQFVKVNEDQYVVNLFGQNTYGYNGNRFTNYEAIYSALEKVSAIAKKNKLSVAIPFKIGCDRGGANWEIVYKMIETLLKDIEVVIYKLK